MCVSSYNSFHLCPFMCVAFLLICSNSVLFSCQVEMVHGKRLNAQKFSIGGTPRKVLFHSESRSLLVLRTGLSDVSCSSDVVQVDPQNGVLLSRFKCEPGETAKCMQVTKIGSEQLLIVGTSKSAGRPMMPNGEAERFTPYLVNTNSVLSDVHGSHKQHLLFDLQLHDLL
jgi:hypothetical protein